MEILIWWTIHCCNQDFETVGTEQIKILNTSDFEVIPHIQPKLPVPGNFHIVKAFNLLGNVPLNHAAGIQRQNLVFHPAGIAVVFADDFRIVIAFTVSGHIDVNSLVGSWWSSGNSRCGNWVIWSPNPYAGSTSGSAPHPSISPWLTGWYSRTFASWLSWSLRYW